MALRILHEGESRSRLVRTAIYARVSTTNNGQDPKMQTRELREYCKHRGWKFAGEYVDEGISGAKDSRLRRGFLDIYPVRRPGPSAKPSFRIDYL